MNSYRKGLAYEGQSIDLWLWTATYMIGTNQKCQRRYISIIPSIKTLAFPTDKISIAITAYRIFNRGLILNRKISVRFEINTQNKRRALKPHLFAVTCMTEHFSIDSECRVKGGGFDSQDSLPISLVGLTHMFLSHLSKSLQTDSKFTLETENKKNQCLYNKVFIF